MPKMSQKNQQQTHKNMLGNKAKIKWENNIMLLCYHSVSKKCEYCLVFWEVFSKYL